MTSKHPLPVRSRYALLQRLLLVVTVLLAPLATASVSPTQSPNDPNQYRFIELDNGLRVILASDPETDKAAAP